uniref:Transmembrane protein n=1 Tax=Cacopsylla melanoneura TaxID=428564 RepID=A0A8D9AKV2_9HEMI
MSDAESLILSSSLKIRPFYYLYFDILSTTSTRTLSPLHSPSVLLLNFVYNSNQNPFSSPLAFSSSCCLLNFSFTSFSLCFALIGLATTFPPFPLLSRFLVDGFSGACTLVVTMLSCIFKYSNRGPLMMTGSRTTYVVERRSFGRCRGGLGDRCLDRYRGGLGERCLDLCLGGLGERSFLCVASGDSWYVTFFGFLT